MGTWYHILGVYNESGHWIKTYVNGKLDRMLQGNGTGTGLNDVPVAALGSTTGRFVMGKEPWTSLYYFNGYMDDIRIWNRSLTDRDAKTLYDTTVAVHSSSASGQVANFTDLQCSIPTPPPPTIPAVTVGSSYVIKNLTINGDVAVKGDVTAPSGTSTLAGNLQYTGTYTTSTFLTVEGKVTQVASVSFPNIDLNYLHNQATTWGKVVNGDSTNQTFAFNTLGGNKVIWIKGNLTNPTVTIGGTYAAGGTFVVDGTVTFSNAATTLGADGYPVYIVSQDDVIQTGGNLTLTGGIYTTGNFAHKTCTIVGPVVVNGMITNNALGQSTFTAGAIPWFDNRVLPQPPTLPLYTTSHRGNGP
jgi:hypothetical protein